MNPVFGHGHLRLYLLSLLAERPRHGYELIQALSERFGGTYSPSAGTIYPRLAKLEDEGLVTKSSDGRKTVYAITDAGRAELEARQSDLDSIEDNVTDSVRMLADTVRAGVDQAMKSLRADLASAAREASSGDWASAVFGERGSGGKASAEAPTDKASTAPDAPGTAGSNTDAVRDAEAALDGFRARVRTELRGQSAKGPVSPEALRTFTEELTRVHEQLRANLSR